ncbi:MAG: capsular polysaccharide export protein, LipB/KpsS family [Pseudomonadales bacterium]
MKFLCHAGPWSDVYLSSVVRHISTKNICTILSAHKKSDQSGMWDAYYAYLSEYRNVKFSATTEDEEIIVRCRLLRNIGRDESLLHLNSMRDAIRIVFDRHQPDIVLSETIDSYIMDLMYSESLKRDIPFIGLVTVFVNGYFRVSARGEHNHLRAPDAQEVSDVLQVLENKSYLPDFVRKDKKSPNLSILRKWIRNIIKIPYFFVKRYISGDFYNYHYWQSVIISKQWLHICPRLEIGNDNWLESLTAVSKPIIYVPLQMIPEATVDYWCATTDVINYDNALLGFIDSHEELHFLIKEHPNVIGYRNPFLYDRLSKFANVTICPTQVASNLLFDHYDAVLVWTGTVGFETVLRGKPALCFTHPYYFPNEDYFKLIRLDTSSAQIVDYIEQWGNGLSVEQKRDLVSHLLSGVDKGRLIVDGSWNPASDSDNKEMVLLADSLKRYIDSRLPKC